MFTAFAATAEYLYEQIAPWAEEALGLHSALVTGAGRNQTVLPNLRKDFTSMITAFSPRSNKHPQDLANEGELDLPIATGCNSEGQKLQDCDCVINHDINWNPVRIIHRFGRIDRLGSPNDRIQLVNFRSNIEIEEYTIEQQTGNPMNDLEGRRA